MYAFEGVAFCEIPSGDADLSPSEVRVYLLTHLLHGAESFLRS